MNKQPIRMLMVDDSPTFLDAATTFLSRVPRFEVVGRALSGEEALEQVHQLQPDLVLLDLAMPGMDGLEVTRRLKAQSGADVLFSWIYDDFNELPYLRVIGDAGSGKTRFLLTVGSLCYKPIFASGASTVSPLFRALDIFRGTLLIDEGDFPQMG
jgi:CheY-like chemotaxis protein